MSKNNPTPTRAPSGGTNPRQGMPAAGFQSVLHVANQFDRGARPQTPSFSRMSPADFAYEHGRLTEKIEQKDAMIRQLRAEADMLSQANQLARGQISDLKIKLRNAEVEKANLLKELNRVGEELNMQKDAMTKTNEKVAKQAITIKVQSDQIAQRTTGNKGAVTPHRGGPPTNYSNVYNQPPPAFKFNGEQATPSRHNGGPPAHSTPMARQQSATNNHRVTFDLDTARRDIVAPVHPGLAFGEIQLMSVRDNQPAVDLGFEIKHVFILSETWARNYANAAMNPAEAAELPAKLIACIMQFTNPRTAEQLMSSGATRYFCIAKLINYQITTLAFRPLLVKGFTSFYDNKISDLRKQMQGVIPLHIRRAIITACADIFTEMTTHPGFQQHVNKVVQNQVHEMWNFLEPLFAPGVARNEAWNDLTEIWKEAARTGVLMIMRPSNFSLDYPAVGSSSLFNPAQMTSRDVNFRQDPQTLSQMGVSVRLAITPVITETDYLATALLPKVLHKSNVLLSK